MQWSCPHCGVSLAVAEHLLGTGWSFSRCYKCGGFALIRRVEINVIKVDKAPPGERVLLPEAVQDPSRGLFSDEATRNYNRHVVQKQRANQGELPYAASPMYYHGMTSPSAEQMAAFQPHQNQTIAAPIQNQKKNADQAVLAVESKDTTKPHDKIGHQPLSHTVTQPAQAQVNPSHQAQNQAQTPAQPHAAEGKSIDSVLDNASTYDISAADLPEPMAENTEPSNISKVIPYGISVTGGIAILSGIYLLVQSQVLWHKAKQVAKEDQTEERESNSRIAANSEAPSQAKGKEIISAPTLLAKESVTQENTVTPVIAQNHVITDQVQQSAMAPMKTDEKPTLLHPPLSVKIRNQAANLHTGPGLEFPVIGNARPEGIYQVTAWKNRWFRIVSQNSEQKEPIGWIRNDKVQVITNPADHTSTK